MPRGSKIRLGELAGRLASLDIDEGVKIEHSGAKMFVNRSASGIFVVQFDNPSEVCYLDSARQVITLARSKFGSKATAWVY